jgi:hypothetical protein
VAEKSQKRQQTLRSLLHRHDRFQRSTKRIARSRPVSGAFLEELEQWLSQPGPVADEDVRMGLKRWVPEYEPARH